MGIWDFVNLVFILGVVSTPSSVSTADMEMVTGVATTDIPTTGRRLTPTPPPPSGPPPPTSIFPDIPTTPEPTTPTTPRGTITPPPPPPSPPPPPTSIFPSPQPTTSAPPITTHAPVTGTMDATTHMTATSATRMTEASPTTQGVVTTREPTEPPITPPHEPSVDLYEAGGIVVILATSKDQFIETQEQFREAVADIVNDYCSQTVCWDYDELKPVRSQDVIIYSIGGSAVSSARLVKRAASVSVSFYVKSPLSSNSIAMSSGQLEDAILTNEEELEAALGYGVTVEDSEVDNEQKDYLLEPWITSILVVAGVSVIVVVFVVYVAKQNKKKRRKRESDGDDDDDTEKGNSIQKTDFSTTTKQDEIIKETGYTISEKPEVDDADSLEKKKISSDEDETKSDPGSSSSITVKADIESSSPSGSTNEDGKVQSDGEAPPVYAQVSQPPGDEGSHDSSDSGHDNPAMVMDEPSDVKEAAKGEEGDDEEEDDDEEDDVTTSL